jgi:hypothetical protein
MFNTPADSTFRPGWACRCVLVWDIIELPSALGSRGHTESDVHPMAEKGTMS